MKLRKKTMIKILAILLFMLWLLGAFGMYSIGWPYHILLIASVMLFFVGLMRTRKIVLTQIMKNNELSETDAEQVKEIMEEHKLNEQEAIELLKIRSGLYAVNGSNLLQTEAGGG
jgi:hypothetical protein